ncbi:SRPBCC family protein [Methylopila musalis]|uniref:SRPBCC family protein n=1 Tax=Methylopila musalis TaxID=1134781 RepID=A0ABW3Z4N9_9HYPH
MPTGRILLAAALSLACGSAALAAEVTQTAEIKASPEKVWAASAKDFCGIGQFHPAIEKCTLSEGGKKRTLSLKGGGEIVETQTAEKAGHSYSYVIDESPLPVADYKATFALKGHGDATTITWTAAFKPKGADEAAAKKVIEGIFSSGLAALQAKF